MVMTSKEHFNRCIDLVVLEKLKVNHDFYQMMKNNDGIHPIDYLSSFRRLYRSGKIKRNEYKGILKSAHRKGFSPGEDSIDCLPVPHMLDYDWRFSQRSIRYLCNLLRNSAPRENGTIVFLGTPTLWKYCIDHLPERLKLILIDVNAKKHISTIASSNIIAIDADVNYHSNELKRINADIVIMDPPWYFNYYQLFFDRVNMMSRIGTLVYCIMPPRFTRASAEQETIDLLKLLDDEYGFEKVSYHTKVVSYHTPPFEVNVLKSHGIECLPPNWRVGDLLIVEKMGFGYGNTKNLAIIEDSWDEYQIESIRIRVLHEDKASDSSNINLFGLYNNDIYPSVKRSSNKKNVNVWTSGNRVFMCDNPQMLRNILSNWGRIETYEGCTADEMRSIGEVQRIIEETIEIEMKEYGDRWRWQ